MDTHPIHFHLYDVQLLNRVTWDNILSGPSQRTRLEGHGSGEPVGRYILRDPADHPEFPFEIPNSIRPLNPKMPLGNAGEPGMFNSIDANGNPTDPIVNKLVNFGWDTWCTAISSRTRRWI